MFDVHLSKSSEQRPYRTDERPGWCDGHVPVVRQARQDDLRSDRLLRRLYQGALRPDLAGDKGGPRQEPAGLRVAAIARFIARLDPEVPYILLGFYPHFYLRDLPTTSRRHALRCKEAAEREGLRTVRIGNLHLLGEEY